MNRLKMEHPILKPLPVYSQQMVAASMEQVLRAGYIDRLMRETWRHFVPPPAHTPIAFEKMTSLHNMQALQDRRAQVERAGASRHDVTTKQTTFDFRHLAKSILDEKMLTNEEEFEIERNCQEVKER